ncbi:hypothetical protein T11_17801 [Trichinella zimbabwensis]|uniref:Uncharacterized protein n=1 Tax=Trichinella zimbabwensis TaxID=268475 RepID=A0A0V1F3E9_9BILA|nr:hypothetical protein T11_17801 [Trichinella zimbabwensis]
MSNTSSTNSGSDARNHFFTRICANISDITVVFL